MSDQQPPESDPVATPDAATPETAAGGGRNRLVLVGAVVVVVIVVVAGLLTVVLRGGGPQSAAKSLVDAAVSGDCNLGKYFSNGEIGASSESKREAAITKFDKGLCKGTTKAQRAKDVAGCKASVSEAKTKGDKATVPYRFTGCKDSDKDEKGTLQLIKESGDWRVSFE